MVSDEGVVDLVERATGAELIFLGMVLPLGLEAVAQRVAHADESAQSLRGALGQRGEDDQLIALPSGQLALVERERIRLHLVGSRDVERRSRNGRGRFDGPVDVLREVVECRLELFPEVASVADQRRFVLPIHPAREAQLAEHQFRSGREVFVERDGFAEGVGVAAQFPPGRSGPDFSRHPLSQEYDVGGDFGVGVALEGVVGQPDGSD